MQLEVANGIETEVEETRTFLGKTVPNITRQTGDTGQKLRAGREANHFETVLLNRQKFFLA